MFPISAKRGAQGEHPRGVIAWGGNLGSYYGPSHLFHEEGTHHVLHPLNDPVLPYLACNFLLAETQTERCEVSCQKTRGQASNKSRDITGVSPIYNHTLPLKAFLPCAPPDRAPQGVHLRRCRAKPKFSSLVALGKQKGKPPRLPAAHGRIPAP